MFKRLRSVFGGSAGNDIAAPNGPQVISAEQAGIVPPISDKVEYRAFLRSALGETEDEALRRLHNVADHLPMKTRRLDFGIHLSQESNGGFNIRLHAGGPDIFVLNKAIASWAELFDGTPVGFGGRRANVPMFASENPPFNVTAVIVEESADWVRRLWSRASLPDLIIPVGIFAEDGWASDFGDPVVLFEGSVT